jgi:hypothetical protein
MKKKSIVEFSQILAECTYKGWDFEVTEQSNGETFLMLRWMGECADTGKLLPQSSRKWKLSPWMTKSEVVQTAFMAVMAAEEHETRECFKYKEQAVFGPHFDVDDLAELVRRGRKDVRA